MTLLTLLASLALTVLAPTFHCHQFGEATRMARDSGFSAVLVGGVLLAVFGTIRAFRREVESGTLEMTLARPVSRTRFFLSKTLGATLATSFVAAIVMGATLVIVEGAAEGGRLADASGDLARVWGPCVAVGVLVILAPVILSAVLNRFGCFRFVLSSVSLAGLFSAAGAVWVLCRDPHPLCPLLVGFLPIFFLIVFFSAVAAAFSFRLRANSAASLTGLVLLAFLPFVGNYYRTEALANGGVLSGWEVALSAVAIVPGIAAFLVLGCHSRGEE